MNVALPNVIELCAGYGGFSLALAGVARTVAYVERDAYAAATLVARMEESRLDQAPIWSDLTTFDGAVWCGRVDLITAGFPCQPFSAAGQRRGTDDDRWLWPDIARIIRDVRPRYIFLENVPQLVRHGLPYVLADLAELGFDAEWGLYSAAAVGAPHRRQRFWLVAHTTGVELEPAGFERQVGVWRNAGRQGRSVADPDRNGQPRVRRESVYDGYAWHDVDRPGSANVADPEGARSTVTDRSRRSGATLTEAAGFRGFPPRPDDLDGWQRWEGPQPGVRRRADGVTPWLADALHLGGNGLVPQCAREAWNQLTERLTRG